MAKNGALLSGFTINAAGDRIQFSQGNLQYVASTTTWSFAAHQYDAIGNAVGNTTAVDDRASQANPIDLFGWGTGTNPTLATENNTDYDSFNEWGANAISNGGNTANLWRTLSSDEWNYLFHERTDADKKFGHATVNSTYGIIILPDIWTDPQPNSKVFKASPDNDFTWSGYDYTSINAFNYNLNEYTAAEWTALENAGAVFLPVTGNRAGVTVWDETRGWYWASNATASGTKAYHLHFGQQDLQPSSEHDCYNGGAVRLVRAFKVEAGDSCVYNGVKYQFVMKPGELVVFVPAQTWTEETLTIPDSIEYYGKKYQVYYIYGSAFEGNTTIKTVNLSCLQIWQDAFKNCTNLTAVNLNEGVDEIFSDAFTNIGATSISLPKSMRSLDNSSGCPFANNKFTEIKVHAENPYLFVGEDGALYTNKESSLKRYTLVAFPFAFEKPFKEVPEGVMKIQTHTFDECTNLADTLILPESLTTAEETFRFTKVKCVIVNCEKLETSYSFFFADELEEVIFGKKVEKIPNKMFYGCDAISKITIQGEIMPDWKSTHTSGFCPFDDDVITNAKLYVNCGWGDSYKADADKWGEFTPANIIDTLMYDVTLEAEQGTAEITSTTDCNKVNVSISGIPSGYTFVKWNNGETTTTASYTITSDTVIRAIVKKDKLIGETFTAETVEGVPVTYKILKKNKERGEFTVQVGEADYSRQAISKDYAGTLTIPDSAVYYDEKYAVVKVSNYAFMRCNVTQVILPDGIAEIGQDAFAYSKITSMAMPNTVTTMKSEAFYECTSLASLTLSNSLTEIAQRGFEKCIITELDIPASVEYLYGSSFANCTSLATVTWHPENLKQIGSRPFQNTPWFEAYPAEENGAKYAGDKLLGGSNDVITSFAVKDGTKMIASTAVELFNNVTDIYVPASVDSIGWGAFYDSKLERCTLNIATPPTFFNGENKVWDNGVLGKDLFNPSCSTKVFVYVPKEAVATYKAHAKWTAIADNIRPIGGWTVEFKDHNGINIIAPQQVEQGQAPVGVPTSVDTYYTDAYMYVFANAWDTAIVNTGDTLYTARYTQNPLPEYKVHWLKADGGEEMSFTKFKHGYSAESKGAEIAAELEEPACMQFDKWSQDLSSITAEISVYPIWKDAAYTLTFVDGLTNDTIAEIPDRECHEDVDISLILIPEHAGYTFRGWDSEAYKNVTSNLTIKALYDTATGLERPTTNDQRLTTKFIKDGQLFILINGSTYNATGARVE